MTNVLPDPDEVIGATSIAAELVRLTGHRGPGLRKLLELAADARAPALEKRGRYWVVRRRNLPALAHQLGLPLKSAAGVEVEQSTEIEPRPGRAA